MDANLSLLGDIYEAALNAGVWPSLLERIAKLVNRGATVFSMHDPVRQWGAFVAGVRLDEFWQSKYDGYYCRLNSHAQKLAAQLSVGEIGTGQMAISDEALIRTEYYNDFLKPQEMFHVAGGVIGREGTLDYLFTTYRSRGTGRFREQKLALVQTVLPHMVRAARISRELPALSCY